MGERFELMADIARIVKKRVLLTAEPASATEAELKVHRSIFS